MCIETIEARTAAQTKRHLECQIAQAQLDGARQLINTLTAAGQLSPLQVEAAHEALRPLHQVNEATWKAFMDGFDDYAVVAEVVVVAPLIVGS